MLNFTLEESYFILPFIGSEFKKNEEVGLALLAEISLIIFFESHLLRF
jgi:hypothetical protein